MIHTSQQHWRMLEDTGMKFSKYEGRIILDLEFYTHVKNEKKISFLDIQVFRIFCLTHTLSFFFNFYCYSITVVCIFSPSLHLTPAKHTSLPRLHAPPWFCQCFFPLSSSYNLLSPMTPPTLLWLLLQCSQFQCLWL